MAKSVSSVDSHRGKPHLERIWSQSVDEALNGGVTLGTPNGQDAAGVYNKFVQDTSSGKLFRVGNAASTEDIKWTAPNVGVVINHGLQRQPIGFYIVDKDKTVDVYRTAVPNENTITLAPTDSTVNTTIYIF